MRSPRVSSILTVLGILWAAALFPGATAGPTGRVLEPKDFDRLDGHGPTTKKVDVIEWEGNLEIHVYPKGALKSLGMKIDKESKSTKNKVMVIEYGFNGVAYTLIRRAVLSIPLPDNFKAFRDETAVDYDKIIVSGNGIANAKIFALSPPPTQLYPDYHPSLAQEESSKEKTADEPAKSYNRKNASEEGIQFKSADQVEQDSRGTLRKRGTKPSTADEDGAIRSFAF